MSDPVVPIEDYIDADVAPERDGPFEVSGPREAAWALRKLGEAQARITQHRAERDRVVQQADRWLEEVTAEPKRSVEFFEGLLTEYHRTVLLAEQEAGVPDKRQSRTIKLRTGTLSAHKAPDRVEFDSEDAFVPWALDNRHELVKVEPRKNEIKKTLRQVGLEPMGSCAKPQWQRLADPDTGEVAPGVMLLRGDIRFSVTPATDEATETDREEDADAG